MKSIRYEKLSYTISAQTTAIGWAASGETPEVVKVTPYERISQGDRANSSLVELFNHCGTHIDLPNHVSLDDRALADFTIDELVFHQPLVVDLPLGDDELLSVDHLAGHSHQLQSCDLLLIRSGFSRHRGDLKHYAVHTPGVSVAAAHYLIEYFPNIKAVGVDFLSFETLSDVSHEFKGHATVLGHGVLIIEDLDLRAIENENLGRVFAIPLFIEEVDSFPATVFAEIYE